MFQKMLRPPGMARATSRRVFATLTGLTLVVMVFTASLFFFRPAAARTQTDTITRIETFALGVNGVMYHAWSDDNEHTWSAWTSLGTPAGSLSFVSGTPAVVSAGVGNLNVFAMDNLNDLEYNTFNNNSWSGWKTGFPGTDGAGVCIPARSDCYEFTSDPAASSWGPGRMDLFMYGVDDAGTVALLHTWADQNVWSGSWEVLGTGSMQGNPTAVSWDTGRVDVFVRGGGNELDHKWFGNGQWSSGWENLGGILTSSPAVASREPGDLVVFVRNTNNGLSTRGFNSGSWGAWSNDPNSNTMGSSPSAAAGSFLNWFALDPAGNLEYSNATLGVWQGFATPVQMNPPAAAVWNPTPPAPPITPTPTHTPIPKPPSCGPTTGRPCPVTP